MLNSSIFLENLPPNDETESTMEETVFSSFLWWAGLKGEEHITRSTIRRSARVQCRSGEISAPAAPHSNDLMSHCYVRAQSCQQFHVMKSLIETAKIRMENIAC